ncbi:hypothetical protein [Parapedobacter indicus]|uniref:Uncharacterized protein n=1 Tax=Parapedobacter indicus TaxID=1477437 RepID=A0A1I3VCC1_9SPHI|nr:hypothetical protein [Parapedobacter indicus]PPK98920.1 hypothetical protein CLV26_11630 [Parapedobacter indicus]SFJ92852.1 hypothetical protein SAMN05444682_11654 [Parapedobacter indicus]
MKGKNNIVEVVYELDEQGYTEEFRIKDEKLLWVEKSVKYNADQFEIDHAYRLESSDTAEDSSLVYGISIPKKGIKGILIDAFNTLSSLEDNFVIHKIRSAETTLLTLEDSNSDLKFGILPKVHKSKFNENPHRYVLRKDFPDFPACPFGQSFSMLGYDTKLKEYVWLVTSILRDERLETVYFKEPSNSDNKIDPSSKKI